VTDFIEPRSSVVVRPYCPGCEPETDPMAELLELRWCPTHTPAWDGTDDALVAATARPGGSAEAGGEDNRRWCELIHRQSRVVGYGPASAGADAMGV
jgi:hypothetical protein